MQLDKQKCFKLKISLEGIKEVLNIYRIGR